MRVVVVAPPADVRGGPGHRRRGRTGRRLRRRRRSAPGRDARLDRARPRRLAAMPHAARALLLAPGDIPGITPSSSPGIVGRAPASPDASSSPRSRRPPRTPDRRCPGRSPARFATCPRAQADQRPAGRRHRDPVVGRACRRRLACDRRLTSTRPERSSSAGLDASQTERHVRTATMRAGPPLRAGQGASRAGRGRDRARGAGHGRRPAGRARRGDCPQLAPLHAERDDRHR